MTTTHILPPGFEGVLAKVIAAKKAAEPPKPMRRGLLAEVERDIGLGKLPPLLEFKSAVNYTYNRHAEALFKLWQKGNVKGLEAYPIKGVNTYSRALAKYREILVGNLKDSA